MDLYHVWFDLKPGTSDVTFVENAEAFLGHLAYATFALYRDFSDPFRERGEERF